MQELINRKVSLNVPGGTHLGTALHAAVWRGHNNLVAMLVDAGADQSCLDIKHAAAVDLAIYKAHNVEALKILDEGVVEPVPEDGTSRLPVTGRVEIKTLPSGETQGVKTWISKSIRSTRSPPM